MDVAARARDLWRQLAEPSQWSRRRVVGESALTAVLGFVTAAAEYLGGHNGLRIGLVTLAAVVCSLARRALPVPALVAAGALSGYAGGGALLITVVGWSAGRRIDGVLRASTAFGACFGLYTVLSLWPWPQRSVVPFVFGTVLFLVLAVFPALAARYWTQRRTLLRTLQELNVQLLRERRMVAGQARMRERQRIAQDMHDSLGHQLTLISVHTGALEVDPQLTGRQREVAAVLRAASMTAMRELRAVVGVLGDDTAQGAEASQGLAGVKSLVESAAATGTPVSFTQSGTVRPLAPAAGHAGYRVAQEGLTNAYKHAPGAPITVSLYYEPDSLVVEVVNAPPPETGGEIREVVSGGQGLSGLRERTRLASGMVHAGRSTDGGFRLAGVFPYESATSPADAPGAPAAFDSGGDDFGWQHDAAASGEGGPVIDRLDPLEEFKRIMGARRGNGLLVGCGIAALLLAAVAVVCLIGVLSLGREADGVAVGPRDYAAVTVGDSEAQVRQRLPSRQSAFTAGLRDRVPAAPAGASCLVFESGPVWDGSATETLYRFCFMDGKLAAKQTFRVPR